MQTRVWKKKKKNLSGHLQRICVNSVSGITDEYASKLFRIVENIFLTKIRKAKGLLSQIENWEPHPLMP